MIITIRQLKNRVRKYGKQYYRYIGRTISNDGLRSYAIIDDCYNQTTIHVEEDDGVVAAVVGDCEY